MDEPDGRERRGSERIDTNSHAEVRIELRSANIDIPMGHRRHRKDGSWHVYGLVVGGVSLVKNYRSPFEKIIRSNSYPELLRRLRDRTTIDEGNATRPSS